MNDELGSAAGCARRPNPSCKDSWFWSYYLIAIGGKEPLSSKGMMNGHICRQTSDGPATKNAHKVRIGGISRGKYLNRLRSKGKGEARGEV